MTECHAADSSQHRVPESSRKFRVSRPLGNHSNVLSNGIASNSHVAKRLNCHLPDRTSSSGCSAQSSSSGSRERNTNASRSTMTPSQREQKQLSLSPIGTPLTSSIIKIAENPSSAGMPVMSSSTRTPLMTATVTSLSLESIVNSMTSHSTSTPITQQSIGTLTCSSVAGTSLLLSLPIVTTPLMVINPKSSPTLTGVTLQQHTKSGRSTSNSDKGTTLQIAPASLVCHAQPPFTTGPKEHRTKFMRPIPVPPLPKPLKRRCSHSPAKHTCNSISCCVEGASSTCPLVASSHAKGCTANSREAKCRLVATGPSYEQTAKIVLKCDKSTATTVRPLESVDVQSGSSNLDNLTPRSVKRISRSTIGKRNGTDLSEKQVKCRATTASEKCGSAFEARQRKMAPTSVEVIATSKCHDVSKKRLQETIKPKSQNANLESFSRAVRVNVTRYTSDIAGKDAVKAVEKLLKVGKFKLMNGDSEGKMQKFKGDHVQNEPFETSHGKYTAAQQHKPAVDLEKHDAHRKASNIQDIQNGESGKQKCEPTILKIGTKASIPTELLNNGDHEQNTTSQEIIGIPVPRTAAKQHEQIGRKLSLKLMKNISEDTAKTTATVIANKGLVSIRNSDKNKYSRISLVGANGMNKRSDYMIKHAGARTRVKCDKKNIDNFSEIAKNLALNSNVKATTELTMKTRQNALKLPYRNTSPLVSRISPHHPPIKTMSEGLADQTPKRASRMEKPHDIVGSTRTKQYRNSVTEDSLVDKDNQSINPHRCASDDSTKQFLSPSLLEYSIETSNCSDLFDRGCSRSDIPEISLSHLSSYNISEKKNEKKNTKGKRYTYNCSNTIMDVYPMFRTHGSFPSASLRSTRSQRLLEILQRRTSIEYDEKWTGTDSRWRNGPWQTTAFCTSPLMFRTHGEFPRAGLRSTRSDRLLDIEPTSPGRESHKSGGITEYTWKNSYKPSSALLSPLMFRSYGKFPMARLRSARSDRLLDITTTTETRNSANPAEHAWNSSYQPSSTLLSPVMFRTHGEFPMAGLRSTRSDRLLSILRTGPNEKETAHEHTWINIYGLEDSLLSIPMCRTHGSFATIGPRSTRSVRLFDLNHNCGKKKEAEWEDKEHNWKNCYEKITGFGSSCFRNTAIPMANQPKSATNSVAQHYISQTKDKWLDDGKELVTYNKLQCRLSPDQIPRSDNIWKISHKLRQSVAPINQLDTSSTINREEHSESQSQSASDDNNVSPMDSIENPSVRAEELYHGSFKASKLIQVPHAKLEEIKLPHILPELVIIPCHVAMLTKPSPIPPEVSKVSGVSFQLTEVAPTDSELPLVIPSVSELICECSNNSESIRMIPGIQMISPDHSKQELISSEILPTEVSSSSTFFSAQSNGLYETELGNHDDYKAVRVANKNIGSECVIDFRATVHLQNTMDETRKVVTEKKKSSESVIIHSGENALMLDTVDKAPKVSKNNISSESVTHFGAALQLQDTLNLKKKQSVDVHASMSEIALSKGTSNSLIFQSLQSKSNAVVNNTQGSEKTVSVMATVSAQTAHCPDLSPRSTTSARVFEAKLAISDQGNVLSATTLSPEAISMVPISDNLEIYINDIKDNAGIVIDLCHTKSNKKSDISLSTTEKRQKNEYRSRAEFSIGTALNAAEKSEHSMQESWNIRDANIRLDNDQMTTICRSKISDLQASLIETLPSADSHFACPSDDILGTCELNFQNTLVVKPVTLSTPPATSSAPDHEIPRLVCDQIAEYAVDLQSLCSQYLNVTTSFDLTTITPQDCNDMCYISRMVNSMQSRVQPWIETLPNINHVDNVDNYDVFSDQKVDCLDKDDNNYSIGSTDLLHRYSSNEQDEYQRTKPSFESILPSGTTCEGDIPAIFSSQNPRGTAKLNDKKLNVEDDSNHYKVPRDEQERPSSYYAAVNKNFVNADAKINFRLSDTDTMYLDTAACNVRHALTSEVNNALVKNIALLNPSSFVNQIFLTEQVSTMIDLDNNNNLLISSGTGLSDSTNIQSSLPPSIDSIKVDDNTSTMHVLNGLKANVDYNDGNSASVTSSKISTIHISQYDELPKITNATVCDLINILPILESQDVRSAHNGTNTDGIKENSDNQSVCAASKGTPVPNLLDDPYNINALQVAVIDPLNVLLKSTKNPCLAGLDSSTHKVIPHDKVLTSRSHQSKDPFLQRLKIVQPVLLSKDLDQKRHPCRLADIPNTDIYVWSWNDKDDDGQSLSDSSSNLVSSFKTFDSITSMSCDDYQQIIIDREPSNSVIKKSMPLLESLADIRQSTISPRRYQSDTSLFSYHTCMSVATHDSDICPDLSSSCSIASTSCTSIQTFSCVTEKLIDTDHFLCKTTSMASENCRQVSENNSVINEEQKTNLIASQMGYIESFVLYTYCDDKQGDMLLNTIQYSPEGLSPGLTKDSCISLTDNTTKRIPQNQLQLRDEQYNLSSVILCHSQNKCHTPVNTSHSSTEANVHPDRIDNVASNILNLHISDSKIIMNSTRGLSPIVNIKATMSSISDASSEVSQAIGIDHTKENIHANDTSSDDTVNKCIHSTLSCFVKKQSVTSICESEIVSNRVNGKSNKADSDCDTDSDFITTDTDITATDSDISSIPNEVDKADIIITDTDVERAGCEKNISRIYVNRYTTSLRESVNFTTKIKCSTNSNISTTIKRLSDIANTDSGINRSDSNISRLESNADGSKNIISASISLNEDESFQYCSNKPPMGFHRSKTSLKKSDTAVNRSDIALKRSNTNVKISDTTVNLSNTALNQSDVCGKRSDTNVNRCYANESGSDTSINMSYTYVSRSDTTINRSDTKVNRLDAGTTVKRSDASPNSFDNKYKQPESPVNESNTYRKQSKDIVNQSDSIVNRFDNTASRSHNVHDRSDRTFNNSKKLLRRCSNSSNRSACILNRSLITANKNATDINNYYTSRTGTNLSDSGASKCLSVLRRTGPVVGPITPLFTQSYTVLSSGRHCVTQELSLNRTKCGGEHQVKNNEKKPLRRAPWRP